MARGWESKSVEEQMASTQQYAPAYPETESGNEETRRVAEHVRTQRERQKQALNLQRENILSQRTSNADRRAALESALKEIEAQIVKLN
jgi:hypothetical protein